MVQTMEEKWLSALGDMKGLRPLLNTFLITLKTHSVFGGREKGGEKKMWLSTASSQHAAL